MLATIFPFVVKEEAYNFVPENVRVLALAANEIFPTAKTVGTPDMGTRSPTLPKLTSPVELTIMSKAPFKSPLIVTDFPAATVIVALPARVNGVAALKINPLEPNIERTVFVVLFPKFTPVTCAMLKLPGVETLFARVTVPWLAVCKLISSFVPVTVPVTCTSLLNVIFPPPVVYKSIALVEELPIELLYF